jgi:hypothetical protein
MNLEEELGEDRFEGHSSRDLDEPEQRGSNQDGVFIYDSAEAYYTYRNRGRSILYFSA